MANALIILYHPDVDHLSRTLTVLAELNWNVVLVDNTSSPLALVPPKSVTYLHLKENRGIAEAQNIGLAALKEQGAEKTLILDQDSEISETLLRGLVEAYRLAHDTFGKVAAVGPQVVCGFSHTHVKPLVQQCLEERNGLKRVRQIIASGMLVNLSCVEDVGDKDTALFIDGVDHEWCWRANSAGYAIVVAKDVTMLHKQGDGRVKICGVTFKQGSPIRLYYQFRNVFELSKRPYVPLYWKLRQAAALPLRWVVNRMFMEDGKLRGKYMKAGFVDGLKGKLGKYAE